MTYFLNIKMLNQNFPGRIVSTFREVAFFRATIFLNYLN